MQKNDETADEKKRNQINIYLQKHNLEWQPYTCKSKNTTANITASNYIKTKY